MRLPLKTSVSLLFFHFSTLFFIVHLVNSLNWLKNSLSHLIQSKITLCFTVYHPGGFTFLKIFNFPKCNNFSNLTFFCYLRKNVYFRILFLSFLGIKIFQQVFPSYSPRALLYNLINAVNESNFSWDRIQNKFCFFQKLAVLYFQIIHRIEKNL